MVLRVTELSLFFLHAFPLSFPLLLCCFYIAWLLFRFKQLPSTFLFAFVLESTILTPCTPFLSHFLLSLLCSVKQAACWILLFHKKYFIGKLYQICHCFSNVTKVKIVVFWYQPIALCVEWIIVALCFFLVISPFILHFRLTFVLKWFLEDLSLILRLLSHKLHEEIKAT